MELLSGVTYVCLLSLKSQEPHYFEVCKRTTFQVLLNFSCFGANWLSLLLNGVIRQKTYPVFKYLVSVEAIEVAEENLFDVFHNFLIY